MKTFFTTSSLLGIKVDRQGNLYVSGPGGLWIISPEAKHLGTIIAPRHPHNMAWGGDYGRTLYMTAQGSLYTAFRMMESSAPQSRQHRPGVIAGRNNGEQEQ